MNGPGDSEETPGRPQQQSVNRRNGDNCYMSSNIFQVNFSGEFFLKNIPEEWLELDYEFLGMGHLH